MGRYEEKGKRGFKGSIKENLAMYNDSPEYRTV
jgi:hypothetical protein